MDVKTSEDAEVFDYENFEVDTNFGLSDQQVHSQRQKYGFNKLTSSKKINPFMAFVNQFKDFMIILLLIAAAISIAVAIYEQVTKSDSSTTDTIIRFVEPFIILLVVVLNSILGAYQEVKSDQAVKALEKVNASNSKVIRNGKMINILSIDIVPGDIIVVEAGDTINADAILKNSSNLQVVEASLTGESTAVDKDYLAQESDSEILAEQKNKIFSGTYVTNGRAVALVVATGKNTVIGRVNSLIQNEVQTQTPLQIKLNKLSKIFGYSGIVLLFVSLVAQILLNNVISGVWNNPEIYTNSLITAISLAVAAIPEGLITFTTVLLAIGVAYMTKENAIIKNLPAIETLGSTNIICSDKTGTLTQNKMLIQDLYFENQLLSENDNNYSKFNLLVKQALLCTDAQVHFKNKNDFEEVGDPTETGIIISAYQNSIDKNTVEKENKRLFSLPFDSNRKMMSVLVEYPEYNLVITKGAPDVIFSKLKENTDFFNAQKINEIWANKAYRVLAVATKKVAKDKTTLTFEDENNLEFSGLVALMDPPRVEVKESIKECLRAGIKPVMITGDHLTTAVAIAKELNIYHEGDLAINGSDLAKMSDQELFEQVQKISVYARVNPEDKLRIVKAWQKHNQVVAMTGDGVNDAPALKASDIGCAMGITGTDVSKQAANIILTDDNFSTIVKAVKGGREIFDKIKTVILNLLISSLSEIIVMLFGLFAFRFIFNQQIGADTDFWVLSATQLLWINLLTHGLPAIALGMVHSGDDVMNRKPFNKNESIFARGMGKNLIFQSLVLSFLGLLSYFVVAIIATSLNIRGEEFVKVTSTACFVSVGIAASLSALNLMSQKSLFKCSLKTYKLVYLASIFSLLCVVFAAYVPGVRTVFKMYDPLSAYDYRLWLIPVFLGMGLILANEIKKLFSLKMNKIRLPKL
ncbi:cation-translocating P-type ATPase [Mycoplasmopsis ciconiae]